MTHLDRATALALVEAGKMPLSRYAEMFGPELLPQLQAPIIAPETEREKTHRLFLSTTFKFK